MIHRFDLSGGFRLDQGSPSDVQLRQRGGGNHGVERRCTMPPIT